MQRQPLLPLRLPLLPQWLPVLRILRALLLLLLLLCLLIVRRHWMLLHPLLLLLQLLLLLLVPLAACQRPRMRLIPLCRCLSRLPLQTKEGLPLHRLLWMRLLRRLIVALLHSCTGVLRRGGPPLWRLLPLWRWPLLLSVLVLGLLTGVRKIRLANLRILTHL